MSQPIKTTAYFDEGFRELDDTLRDVMSVLAEAVPAAARASGPLPWTDGDDTSAPAGELTASSAQLYSIAFELLNMVEEHVAFRFRARRRIEHGSTAVNGLWPRMIEDIAAQGCTEDEALAMFRKVRVEPVLTAHPTEAKRPAVREKHLAIYRKLAEWNAAHRDPPRAHRLRSALRAELEGLWLTGEIFIQRPRIENELRNAVYYLREVFPEVVTRLDRSLESAWRDQGWSVVRLRGEGSYPQVRFATWIGGDRDGHPLVTAEVTANCLAELRRHAARLHRHWLRQSADALPLSPPFAQCQPEHAAVIQELARSFGDTGKTILDRNENEPWRAWLYLLREKMRLRSEDGGYQRPADYKADLAILHDSLLAADAPHCADEFVRPLVRLADVFGFHLAALDVRQNSDTHDEAFALILSEAGIEDGHTFAIWSEERRQELLCRELRNRRPLLAPGQPLAPPVEKVIAPLRVLAAHCARFGPDGLGQLIVSMTRQPSDLLLVHVLCREAGLAAIGRETDNRWRAALPVTPLFETRDDLARADEVLQRYFELAGPPPPVQPAMVGYSDSNKDAGVFASQWGIYGALERIAAICREAGSVPQCFHGRGGTIGRGAGPTQWFLRALPPQSLAGPVRFTEQGEVLPRKYAHEGNAHYHLELLVAGVSAAVTTAARREPVPESQRAALDRVASESTAAYHALLRSERFLDFHRAVTPIEALEAGTFGSRPPRRTGSDGLSIENLRAIPWVFSWTQSRFYLPAWFGVGSGLAALQREDPEAWQRLCDGLPGLPFLRYLLTNVESGLASADLDTMNAYAQLCDDAVLRERILQMISAEFDLTRAQLSQFFGKDFSERRPRLNRTIALRDRPLRALHSQQIALLHRWRAENRPVTISDDAFHPLFLALQLNINAIASGLRETG